MEKTGKELKKIGLVCPSYPFFVKNEKEEEDLKKYFFQFGYTPVLAPNIGERERYLGGTDERRAEGVNAFFKDPSVRFILAMRGGYGSMRILDKIDYDAVRQNPKLFMGFSDTTALQLALFAKAGLPSLTGWTFREKETPILKKSLKDCLLKDEVCFKNLKSVSSCKKTAEGTLVGGCLTLVNALIGTPYLPDMEGKILLLEDVEEEPYAIDRMLTHLRLAGVFDKVSGIVFGKFYKCVSSHKVHGTVQEVLDSFFKKVSFPVVQNLPYGHMKKRKILPLGTKAVLDAENGTLRIQTIKF